MTNPKMLVVIPIMGSLHETKSVWGSLLNSTVEADLLIIDNAPDADNREALPFFERFIFPFWPGRAIYDPQEDNIGVINSMQHAYEKFDYDIYAYLHNDVYIYKRGWDLTVRDWVAATPKVGLVGFFGAEGVHPSSGRFHVYNNMLEAEIHGWRTDGLRQVAVLDGMSMFATRHMLDYRGGVDTSFDTHHFYDLDLSLESIDRGFHNWILGWPIHDQSGVTACKPLFQDWANRHVGEHVTTKDLSGEMILYQKNLSKFRQKWERYLPWKVGQAWLKG